MGRELPGEKGASQWEESFPVGRGKKASRWEGIFLVARELLGGKRASR